jgi:hypothetical protein
MSFGMIAPYSRQTQFMSNTWIPYSSIINRSTSHICPVVSAGMLWLVVILKLLVDDGVRFERRPRKPEVVEVHDGRELLAFQCAISHLSQDVPT